MMDGSAIMAVLRIVWLRPIELCFKCPRPGACGGVFFTGLKVNYGSEQELERTAHTNQWSVLTLEKESNRCHHIHS